MKSKKMREIKESVTPQEPNETLEGNRGVFISGLNQAVTVISGYRKDSLSNLSNYAIGLFKKIRDMEREER